MLRMFTDNPVQDAEQYAADQEEQADARDHRTCAFCGRPIYRADGLYDGDIYYEIDGISVCEDCVMDYIRKFQKICS